ncbi:MAG: hypothetical protein EXS10_04555 [Phycisphaerales bacterium]|nr:hypothetical protein [Phycisphaerales bacterium]
MEPSFKTNLKMYAQYAAARTAAALLSAFPPEQNLQTAKLVARLSTILSPKRLARAIDHVALAYPERDAAWHATTAMRSIEHMLGIFMVDALVMPRLITRNTWTDRVKLAPGFERALPYLTSEKPCLFVTGHVGNWEILGYVLALIGVQMTAVARPLDNPYISDWLFGIRERSGLKVLTKWGATDELQRVLAEGGKVGFIADQNAGDDGLFVPSFGRLASTYKSIPLLAVHQSLPMICGYAHRVDGAFRYELRMTDVILPSEWESQEDPVFYVGARLNRAIETMVRESPEQNLWVHRRWKSRPKFEREGKPLPIRLRAKIAALPWMTDALLAELAKPLHVRTASSPSAM